MRAYGLLLHGSTPTRRRGVLLVAGAAVLWGTSGLTGTVAYDRGLDPLAVSFWRMAIGTLVLLSLRRRSASAAPRLTRHDIGRIAVIGVGLAGYQAGYFVAVQRAGVSIATLVALGLAPVLVTAADRVRSRDRLPRRTIAGLVLALTGLAALVGLPEEAREGVVVGAAFAACSAIGYAAVTLASGPVSTRLGAERLTVTTFAVAATVLAPLATATGLWSAGGGLPLVAALVYLGVVPTALSYRWFFSGLRRIPASTAAMLALLEPLVATALAIPVRGERLTTVGSFGAVALLSAVVVVAGARSDDRAPS